MAGATLDRSRPFATVFGPSAHRYEQDHKCFDGSGKEIASAGAVPAGSPYPAITEMAATDEGIYVSWKLPALKREVRNRTGSKVPTGTSRGDVIALLQDLDAQGKTGTGVEPDAEADDDEGA